MIRSELRCEKLQPSKSPSWGGSYLLDVESEDSITMLENHWLQNLGSRINFQADRPVSDVVIQKKSELFVSGGQLNVLQTELDMNIAATDDTFYPADLSLEEQWYKYPAPFRIDGIDKLEDVSSMFSEKDVKDMISNPVPSVGGTPSPSVSMQENDHSSVDKNLNEEFQSSKDNADRMDDVGTNTHKRLRKPPKRYIDVISEPTANTTMKRCKSNEKIPVKHHKVLDVKSREQKSRPAPFHIDDDIDQLEDDSSQFSEDVKDSISDSVPSSGETTSPSISMQEDDHSSVDTEWSVECHTSKVNFSKNADEMDTMGTHSSKRVRKPPQRFIDEISEPASNPTKKRVAKQSVKIRVKHHKVLAAKSRDQKSLPEDLLANAIQVPFAPLSCCEEPPPVATKVNIKPLPVATKVIIKPHPVATKVNIEPSFVPTKVKKGLGSHMVLKTKFEGDQETSSSNLKISQAVGPPHAQVRNNLLKPKSKGDQETSSSNLKISQSVGPPHAQERNNLLKPKFKGDQETSSSNLKISQAVGPPHAQERNNLLKPKFKGDQETSSSNLKISQAVGLPRAQVRDNLVKPKFKGDHMTSSSPSQKIKLVVRWPHEHAAEVLHFRSDDGPALVNMSHDEYNGVLKTGENGGQRKHHTYRKIDQPVKHPDEQAVLSSSSSDDRLALATIPQDECNEVLLSEENSGRRKHHILWTMSEVENLIYGVSLHGVGRWSRVKKELFPTSPHRTPVDLKDKWRNLLKAAYIQREGKRVDGKKRNLAWRPLPKSILQRVNELSIKYPYPRDFRSKR